MDSLLVSRARESLFERIDNSISPFLPMRIASRPTTTPQRAPFRGLHQRLPTFFFFHVPRHLQQKNLEARRILRIRSNTEIHGRRTAGYSMQVVTRIFRGSLIPSLLGASTFLKNISKVSYSSKLTVGGFSFKTFFFILPDSNFLVHFTDC